MDTRFADHIVLALFLSVFTFLAYVLTGCAPDGEPSALDAMEPSAFFEFTTDRGEARFVVELRDAAAIDLARKAAAAGDKDLHVYGRIVPEPAAYNARWSYHLDPATVVVTKDNSVEVCDAAIAYVEDHLQEVGGAFLPNNWWCPWSSRFVKPL